MVDFGDEVASDKTNVFGEACWIDLGDEYAFHILESSAARAVCSDIFDTQPELNRGRPILAIGAVCRTVRENPCTIRDRQAGFVLLLVPDVSHADAIANRG